MWLLSEHTDTLFRRAKARVFEVVGTESEARLNVVLEENPKLGLLREVLQEAGSQWRARKRRRRRGGGADRRGEGALSGGETPTTPPVQGAPDGSGATGEDPVRVLVLVRDAVAAATAREYLEVGGPTQLKLRLLDLLRHRNAATRNKAAAWREAQSRASLEKAVSGGQGGKRGNKGTVSQAAAAAAAATQPSTEDRLLLAHEEVLCDQLMVDAAKAESLGAEAGTRKRQRAKAAAADAVDLTGEQPNAEGIEGGSDAPVPGGAPAASVKEQEEEGEKEEEEVEEEEVGVKEEEGRGGCRGSDSDGDSDDFAPTPSKASQSKTGRGRRTRRAAVAAGQGAGAGAAQLGRARRQRQQRRRGQRPPWAAAGQGMEGGEEEEGVSVVTMDDVAAPSAGPRDGSGGASGARGRAGEAQARGAGAEGSGGAPSGAETPAFATTTAPWLAQLRHAVRGTAHEARARSLCEGDDVTSEYPGLVGARVVVFPIQEMDMSVPPLMVLRPHIVVFFDSEPWAVRAVEVYKVGACSARQSTCAARRRPLPPTVCPARGHQASFPTRPLRVYTLMYEETVEEERFRAQLDKEQAAFEKLIQERAHASRRGTGPRSREEQDEMREIERDAQRSQLVAAGQRIGGRLDRQEGTVVVDDRELKSALPFMLYAADLRVVAVTLTVGDYILSAVRAAFRSRLPPPPSARAPRLPAVRGLRALTFAPAARAGHVRRAQVHSGPVLLLLLRPPLCAGVGHVPLLPAARAAHRVRRRQALHPTGGAGDSLRDNAQPHHLAPRPPPPPLSLAPPHVVALSRGHCRHVCRAQGAGDARRGGRAAPRR